MPKEIVFHEPKTTLAVEGEPVAGTLGVQVFWGRGQSVQIGTVFRYESVARAGSENPATMHDSTPGWFLDLDRHEINDLIRVLRRARDQAYGRDE